LTAVRRSSHNAQMSRLLFLTASIALLSCAAALRAGEFEAGAARVDITPDGPIRLTGYAARTAETAEAEQRIFARALAISAPGELPVVAVAVDNCGVCSPIVEEVAARLRLSEKLPRERLVIVSSHTHSGPMTPGFAANILTNETDAQRERIVRYGAQLTDKLEAVCRQALAARRPARLEWNEGRVCFAANRRTPGGPVDHALPVLCVRTLDGKPAAIWANYACHCTTLGGEFNKIHGDWAGCAAEEIEQAFPGAVALVTPGCGADANPSPRGNLDLARRHGRELAEEVRGLIANAMLPLTDFPRCQFEKLELPFSALPSREEWLERAKQPGIVGLHARKQLEILDSGKPLPASLDYRVHTWAFGGALAMVFLSGEVVVDYALWGKSTFDRERLWITAYANDVPCYIPSRRILQEGGYEAESSLWYYNRPARLDPKVEGLIQDAISRQMPQDFRQTAARAKFPPPRSPQQSLAALRCGGALQIELVAAEPLVVDPICIDWDARGRLWVLEMRDYPNGMNGKGQPGGRVKILTDTNGDGLPDHAEIFLDALPFPTGLLCWGSGAWICAAPDILWAEDADGDGRAEKVEKRFSGFATNNYNARVNGLALGLDGWIYGSDGLLGGVIQPGAVNLRGRDFRFHPATGKLEPASGNTQQGRPRDDWGNWFGCDNTNLLWHYPMPEQALARNPSVAPPAARVAAPADADPNRLFPTSVTLERYNQPELANRTTSACGIGVYRDDWLGAAFYGNIFTCEPVHNLLRRHVLERDGVTFRSRRAADEQAREFVSSRDNWSRFTQARTGPDGALWFVDMYRFVIEHPTWIPEDRQREVDLRAGADRGRIFRLRAPGKPLRIVRDLIKLQDAELAAALASPNGTERDRVHIEILRRGKSPAVESLLRHELPRVRAQALWVLHGAGVLTKDAVAAALADPDEGVRAQAVQMAGAFSLPLEKLAEDPAAAVRFQVALHAQDAAALAKLIRSPAAGDPWMRTAILSSAKPLAGQLLGDLLTAPDAPGRGELLEGLIASCEDVSAILPRLASAAASLAKDSAPPWKLLVRLAEHPAVPREFWKPWLDAARESAQKNAQPEALRIASRAGAPAEWVAGFVGGPMTDAALEELAKNRGEPETAAILMGKMTGNTPGIRAKIIRSLMARASWQAALVAAMEAKSVLSGEVPLADRQRLAREHPSARKFLAPPPAQSAADRIKNYARAEALAGNAAHGGALFEQHCAICHALGGKGFAVGPDLAPFRAKPIADLAVAIIDPSRAIEPSFLGYDVKTADGRQRAGVVREETATSFTLTFPGGVRETLLRRDVREMQPLEQSLMPAGLDAVLGPQDLADLAAWLRKTKPPLLGAAAPEIAAKARADFLATKPDGMANVTASAGKEEYASWMGRLPMHYCRQTREQNRLAWKSAPLSAAAEAQHTFTLAAGMGYLSQPEGKFTLKLNGAEILDFGATVGDAHWQRADGKAALSYAVAEANDQDSCGILSVTVAREFLKPGQPQEFEVIGSASDSQRWFAVYLP
jgi:putative membrane-bound dehydrogenase-like protein